LEEHPDKPALTQPVLEETLPSQFIYDIGLYLQTCAHIEISACGLICEIEQLEMESDAFLLRFHELRKLAIAELIKAIGKSAEALSDDKSDSLKLLADWIANNKRYRDIAAHGAFYFDSKLQRIRVLYTHKTGPRANPEYHPETASLTREQILEHIFDADRILRILNGMRVAISSSEL
jgi:hypothetical protein